MEKEGSTITLIDSNALRALIEQDKDWFETLTEYRIFKAFIERKIKQLEAAAPVHNHGGCQGCIYYGPRFVDRCEDCIHGMHKELSCCWEAKKEAPQ